MAGQANSALVINDEPDRIINQDKSDRSREDSDANGLSPAATTRPSGTVRPCTSETNCQIITEVLIVGIIEHRIIMPQ